MRTLLVFPPTSDPAHPPLGIAALAGYLREAGEDVALLDLNLRSYVTLLSADNLAQCAGIMESWIQEFESRPSLAPEDFEQYRLVAENLLSATYLWERVDAARRALRDPATYRSRTQYAEVASILRRSMEFVSAAHYPVRWYLRGFSMSYLPTRSDDVLTAIKDRQQNLFLPLLESTLEDIATYHPDVVGISLNYYCQLIPCITLASLVKARFPRMFVVVGGGLVCFLEGKWSALATFAPYVDGWVFFEGEKPLLELVRRLPIGDVSGVPGLLTFDDTGAVYSPPAPPAIADDLPPPNFDGLPLDEYLSPQLILPMIASRGCYWGRCAFCSHDEIYRGRFRPGTADSVHRHAAILKKRHNAACFYLTDECITPALARGLAAVNGADWPGFEWFAEIRFERFLDSSILGRLFAGGCRMLMFGLESSVPRILDLIDKGITAERASAILTLAHEVGIRTMVMFFVGFPTETRHEAAETIRFVEGHRDSIDLISISNFILEHRSPVYADPSRYGIVDVIPYPDEDLKIFSEYRVTEGMSMKEAAALVQETKQRPMIKELMDTSLLSRSHVVFLPPRQAPVESEACTRLDLSSPETLVPSRSPELMPRTFRFNLSHILRSTASSEDTTSNPLPEYPTNYVFDPVRESLLDVGPDGLSLLGACSGRLSLDEILSAVGDTNREATLGFFADLTDRGFLSWEERR
jgi:radical SAM superfamily enzyme YgiQ (UPF0313 family)